MNTSNPTTVVLSKDAADKIAAAMRKRGEKAGDYFSRMAGVAVAEKSYGGAATQDMDSAFWGAERYPGDRGVAFSPRGPERRSGVHGDLRRMIAGRQVKAGAGSVNRDLVIMGGVYSSPSELRFTRAAALAAEAELAERYAREDAALAAKPARPAANRVAPPAIVKPVPSYSPWGTKAQALEQQAGKALWDAFVKTPGHTAELDRMVKEAKEYMRSRKATKKPRGVTDD